MKKIVNLIFLFVVITTSAQEKSKSKLVDVNVSGLCEMCKARIEKAAFKIKGVKSAEWNPDDKILHLILNEKKTDVLTVQTKMASIGHDTEAILATDEAYNSLHDCCKYDREFKPSCEENCVKPCCKDKVVKTASCCSSTKDKEKSTSCQSKK
jgi:hypothetical protein